jgi:hypothetical protein
MKIVEKWVAGFWIDRLIVVKWKFRETPKTFVIVREEDNPTYRDADTAVGFQTTFRKADPDQQLFDTQVKALARLYWRESKTITQLEGKLRKCRDRRDLIGKISDKMEKADLT